MMAASVSGHGSSEKGGSTLKVVDVISPIFTHHASLHDPDAETSPASPTTTGYMDGDPSDGLEEARSLSHKVQRSLSSAGKQLAESSTLGPKADKLASDCASELSVSNSSTYTDDSISALTGDEAEIALNQLRELEVAIKVRKGSRVDGRKTRWVKHKKQKRRRKSTTNTEPASNSNSSPENKTSGGTASRKTESKVTKKEKPSYKVKHLREFSRNKSSSNSVKAEESIQRFEDSADDIFVTNNNSTVASNFNHSDNSSGTMKVEDTGPVLGPIETNNVLETMKQQFLEGTCNIPETNAVTSKDKKLMKKLKKSEKINSTNDENTKRKPGRPKKKVRDIRSSTPNPEVSSVDRSSSFANTKQESDTFLPIHTEALTPKKENLVVLGMSPEFYLKKNPVTRGLREVRKSESGSESSSSTPVKDTSLHLQLSPASPPLALSPNTSPTKYENTNGATKFPISNAAAKALLQLQNEQKQFSLEFKGNKLKRLSKNFNTMLKHKMSPQKVQAENGDSQNEDCPLSQLAAKRPTTKSLRGRKKGSMQNTWPKKTSMIVADVHNSMNGEPQAVINSTVGRKRKSLPPKMPKADNTVIAGGSLRKSLNDGNIELLCNKENSIRQAVPNLKSSQSLLKTNSASAAGAYDANSMKNGVSKSTNSGAKCNHINFDNKDSLQENGNINSTEDVPKIDVDSDCTKVKVDKSQNSSSSESKCKSLPPINNGTPTVRSTAHSDKKQLLILPFTEKYQPKGNSNLNPLLKSMKLNPNVVTNANGKGGAPNGNYKEDETRSAVGRTQSPSPLASPRKHLSAFSQDKQKKDKYAKSKSLHAVIEKLQKPSVDDCNEPEVVNGQHDNNKEEKSSPCNESEQGSELEAQGNTDGSGKSKKQPRFLRELFKDEGVMLMLGSMKQDSVEGGIALEQAQHKLRPKRINDTLLSESPEPEEPFQKRKKRFTEVDNLFVDEGALNMLTSIDSSTRRQSLSEDNSSEHKVNKLLKTAPSSLKIMEGKKRKLSGISNSSGNSVKASMPENKRMKVSMDILKPSTTGDAVKKKVGRPSNAELLEKKRMQDTQSSLQRNPPKLPIHNPPKIELKSVPPIKIRLNPYEGGSTKPSISPPDKSKIVKPQVSPMNGKPAKSAVPLPVAEAKTSNQSLAEPRGLPSNNQPRYHGVPIKKLLPVGGLKSIKLGLIKPSQKEDEAEKIRSKCEVVRRSLRASVRNNEVNNHFRDIHLRKFNHFMQIIFNPSTTKMKNAFNSGVLRELCEALNYIKKDATVNLVLLTATGSTFCQGIDLTSLQHSNIEIRKKNAANLTRAIKEFLHCLISFPKVIIAGINGNATGLGVTMLPLFDLVLASDKAEFFLPYGELGQVPEGGATYTFPLNYGKLQSNNLFMGKKVTAMQAQSMGLVSETLWHSTYVQELIPKVAAIASHPGPGLEATKALMNHHLMTKLELSVETECRALLQQWGTPSFTEQCKRYLESNYVLYQSPAFRQNQ